MSCPHCGYDVDPEEDECPLCGTPLDGGERGERAAVPSDAGGTSRDSGPGRPGGRATEAGREHEGLTPWEAGGGIGALLRSWWESLSEPRRFFSRIEWDGGLADPLLYYLLFVVVGAGFQSLWFALLTPALYSALGVEGLLSPPDGGVLLQQFFLSPFKALFSLAVIAGVAHLTLRLLADRPRPLRATGRALCYTSGPQLLLAVPLVGGLLALIWSAVLAVVGLRTAHRTSTGRVIAALAAAVLAYLAGSVLWAALVADGFGGSMSMPPVG